MNLNIIDFSLLRNNLLKKRELCRILFCIMGLMLPFSLQAKKPKLLFEEGNKQYQRGQYDSAILTYTSILQSGVEASDLYYNLANAYFRKKNYPHAILNYQKALKMNPNNQDAKFNLQLTQTYTVDRFSLPPQVAFVRWFKTFHQQLAPSTWAMLSYPLFALLLTSVLALLFVRNKSLWSTSLSAAVLFLVLWVVVLVAGTKVQREIKHPQRAVIMQSVVAVKSAPTAQAEDLFLLHAGSTVTLKEEQGEWMAIEIPDGTQGWVQKSTIETI